MEGLHAEAAKDKEASTAAKAEFERLTNSITKKNEKSGTLKLALEEKKSRVSLIATERNDAVQ